MILLTYAFITVGSAIQLTLTLLYIEYDTIKLRFYNSWTRNPTHPNPTLYRV